MERRNPTEYYIDWTPYYDDVVKMLGDGMRSHDIADKLQLPRKRVYDFCWRIQKQNYKPIRRYTKAEILEKTKEGKSREEIAEELGVSESTVYRMLNDEMISHKETIQDKILEKVESIENQLDVILEILNERLNS